MPKVFWHVLLGILIGAGGMLAWNWHDSAVLEAEIAVLKNQNEEKRRELDATIAELAAKSDALIRSNRELEKARVDLRKTEVLLAKKEEELQEEREARLLELPTLPINDVAKVTLAELDLKPPEIEVTTENFLLFSERASRVNLEHLIIGASAVKELAVAHERIDTLKQENQNLSAQLENMEELVETQARKYDAQLARLKLDLEEKDKTIGVLKAKMRKRNFFAALAGYVGGIITMIVTGD